MPVRWPTQFLRTTPTPGAARTPTVPASKPPTAKPLSFWNKVALIASCFAGLDPDDAKPIGDTPQPSDSTDSTSTTEGQPPPMGPNNRNRSVPYVGPEVPVENAGAAAAGGAALAASVSQCISNVLNSWPK